MAKRRSSTGTGGALIRVSDVIEEPWMEGTYPESVMTRDDDAIFGEWWCKRKSECKGSLFVGCLFLLLSDDISCSQTSSSRGV